MSNRGLESPQQIAARHKVEYMLTSGVPANLVLAYIQSDRLARRSLASGLGGELESNTRTSLVGFCAQVGRHDFLEAVMATAAGSPQEVRKAILDTVLSVEVAGYEGPKPRLVAQPRSQSIGQIAARYGYPEMLRYSLEHLDETTRFEVQEGNVFDTLLMQVLIAIGNFDTLQVKGRQADYATCIDLLIAAPLSRKTPFESLMVAISTGAPSIEMETQAKAIYTALIKAGRLPGLGICSDDPSDDKKPLLCHAMQSANWPLVCSVIEAHIEDPALELEIEGAIERAEALFRNCRPSLGDEARAHFRSLRMDRQIEALVREPLLTSGGVLPRAVLEGDAVNEVRRPRRLRAV